MTVLLAFVAAVLFGCGTWLLMQRRLSRIIIGVGLLGHGANLLLVTGGGAEPGRAPIIGADGEIGAVADPLPQALALTAIVITFGITAFLLALGYRSWQITRDDRVEDDVEDRLVARAEADRAEAERAEADRAEADRAEADRAEADRAEADRAGAGQGEESGTSDAEVPG